MRPVDSTAFGPGPYLPGMPEPSSRAGRLLCRLGFHRFHARTKREGSVLVTYNRCAREGCPRYADEFIVDIEIAQARCECRRYASPSPICPVHGDLAA